MDDFPRYGVMYKSGRFLLARLISAASITHHFNIQILAAHSYSTLTIFILLSRSCISTAPFLASLSLLLALDLFHTARRNDDIYDSKPRRRDWELSDPFYFEGGDQVFQGTSANRILPRNVLKREDDYTCACAAVIGSCSVECDDWKLADRDTLLRHKDSKRASSFLRPTVFPPFPTILVRPSHFVYTICSMD